MKRETYDLLEEPTGGAYRDLIRLAAAECTSFQVVHKRRRMTPPVETVMSVLRPFLLERRESSNWPGSEAVGWTAELYRFALTAESGAVLARTADGLYSWQQPNLPEDPSFLRQDGSVWLATITHEREAFFELSPEELSSVSATVPALRLKRRHLEH